MKLLIILYALYILLYTITLCMLELSCDLWSDVSLLKAFSLASVFVVTATVIVGYMGYF